MLLAYEESLDHLDGYSSALGRDVRGVTHAAGVDLRDQGRAPPGGAGRPRAQVTRRLQKLVDLSVLARSRCGRHRLVEPPGP